MPVLCSRYSAKIVISEIQTAKTLCVVLSSCTVVSSEVNSGFENLSISSSKPCIQPVLQSMQAKYGFLRKMLPILIAERSADGVRSLVMTSSEVVPGCNSLCSHSGQMCVWLRSVFGQKMQCSKNCGMLQT